MLNAYKSTHQQEIRDYEFRFKEEEEVIADEEWRDVVM